MEGWGRKEGRRDEELGGRIERGRERRCKKYGEGRKKKDKERKKGQNMKREKGRGQAVIRMDKG